MLTIAKHLFSKITGSIFGDNSLKINLSNLIESKCTLKLRW
ncbi:hypothetical protein HDC90_000269 [Pedobacter sp. AK013]|nr:hypothetical protein [Pedobacter sp. AK013]